MMAFTHGFMSLALALLALPVLSAHVGAPLVLAVAVVGGVAPDLDLFATHRRTLHYPVGFTVLAALLVAAFLATASSGVLLAAVFVGAAATHSVVDVLGGSAERAPWDPTTEHGVYNHLLGRWHRPRRLVRYSGAPEDCLLGAGFVAVAVASPNSGSAAELALLVLVGVAGVYSLARKRLTALPALVSAFVPRGLRALVPAVAVEEADGGGTTLRFRRR